MGENDMPVVQSFSIMPAKKTRSQGQRQKLATNIDVRLLLVCNTPLVVLQMHVHLEECRG